MTKLTLSKIFLFLICVFSLPMTSHQLVENTWFKDFLVEPIKPKKVARIPQEVVIGMIQVKVMVMIGRIINLKKLQVVYRLDLLWLER